MEIKSSLTTRLLPSKDAESNQLLIVLHGLGDSMEGYSFLPEILRLPSLNYLFVNAPDSYYTGYSWYDFANDPGPGVERSFGLLSQLMQELFRSRFSAATTALFGFSQGCLISLEVAARFPEKLSGVVGVSGYVHEPQRLIGLMSGAATQQRILMTHGTQDPMIPIAHVRSQVTLLRKAGLSIEWKEFEKAHTIAGEAEISVIRDFLMKT